MIRTAIVRFDANQLIALKVRNQPIPVEHYLKQPQRLVSTLAESSQIETLGPEHYRLKMKPLSFMMVHIQPVVDLQVRWEPDGCLRLSSTDCQIRGNDYIGQRFQLSLEGYLQPQVVNGFTCLQGSARLQVEVELPAPLSLTPRPLIDTAGNGLLRGVLQTMKQRLSRRLLQDYYHWSASRIESQTYPNTSAAVEAP